MRGKNKGASVIVVVVNSVVGVMVVDVVVTGREVVLLLVVLVFDVEVVVEIVAVVDDMGGDVREREVNSGLEVSEGFGV
ncbi:MAG TPA: hypothetical protein ENH51_02265 [Euryarchaeota archaeon]|nr:hypothetical protein [Euryarchaeota archaeon]